MRLKNEIRFKAYIKQHEGLVLTLYKCSKGYPTIGYGHKCNAQEVERYAKGIRKFRAICIFGKDFDIAVGALYKIFPHCIESLSENRQMALVDMAFNMGEGRDEVRDEKGKLIREGKGLRGFPSMRKAVEEKDFGKAADEILDSKYAREDVPERAKTNADYMRMG